MYVRLYVAISMRVCVCVWVGGCVCVRAQTQTSPMGALTKKWISTRMNIYECIYIYIYIQMTVYIYIHTIPYA